MIFPTNDHQNVKHNTASEDRFLIKLEKKLTDIEEQCSSLYQQCKDFLKSSSLTPQQIKLKEQWEIAAEKEAFYRIYLLVLHDGNVLQKLSEHYFLIKKLFEENEQEHQLLLPLLRALYYDALVTIIDEN